MCRMGIAYWWCHKHPRECRISGRIYRQVQDWRRNFRMKHEFRRQLLLHRMFLLLGQMPLPSVLPFRQEPRFLHPSLLLPKRLQLLGEIWINPQYLTNRLSCCLLSCRIRGRIHPYRGARRRNCCISCVVESDRLVARCRMEFRGLGSLLFCAFGAGKALPAG